VFVTLTERGELRGCIGSLEAWRPLHDDVVANARAAAFNDPRFAPLRAEDLSGVRVEVSLLSPAQAMSFTSEEDAIRQLRPGLDGVILEIGRHRGTFLPQVWESLPEPRQFMAQLKRKAGLPPNFWSADVNLSRYSVEKWKEQT
jgi:AmmeMemoRadiSam system protein A